MEHGSIHGAGTKKAQQPNPCIADSPVPKYDDGNTENFYPITWRVIGGGVMMGGESESFFMPRPSDIYIYQERRARHL